MALADELLLDDELDEELLSLSLESESDIGFSTPERPGFVGLLLLLRVAAARPPA